MEIKTAIKTAINTSVNQQIVFNGKLQAHSQYGWQNDYHETNTRQLSKTVVSQEPHVESMKGEGRYMCIMFWTTFPATAHNYVTQWI